MIYTNVTLSSSLSSKSSKSSLGSKDIVPFGYSVTTPPGPLPFTFSPTNVTDPPPGTVSSGIPSPSASTLLTVKLSFSGSESLDTMLSVMGASGAVMYESSSAITSFLPTILMHTVAVSMPPPPSVTTYSKHSSAVSSSSRLSNAPLGSYTNVPFGYTVTTAPELNGRLVPASTISSPFTLATVNSSPSGSLSFDNMLPDTGVSWSVESVSSSATGGSSSPYTVMHTSALASSLPSEIV
mmetsp:Transcript_23714/g.70143  ORF Transcript_23714/g.70143 Transcript_23714/m.70143 type:complete len:239 (-) Transcript_23714:1338-2054(-)